MTYVEWLRVRRTLIWTAAVLIAGLVVLAVVQVTSNHFLTPSSTGDFKIDGVAGTKVIAGSSHTDSTLPDGTHRATYDAGNGVRITVDDRGYGGKHVEIFEPASSPAKIAADADSFKRTSVAGGTVYNYDSDEPESLSSHIVIAGVVAIIIATILGAPFARENDGHLELAFGKPISRTKLAVEIVLVDLIGVVASWVMTMLFLFAAHAIVEAPQHQFAASDGAVVALSLFVPFAWYAMLSAATASMKHAYGVVQGIAWPVSLLVAGLATHDLGSSSLAQIVHLIATPLSWIDPFTYLFKIGPALWLDPYPTLSVLLLLALVYGALAIYQWRRVEA